MVKYYPVALNLKGRWVVVAGGGGVAQRKIKTLLASGARVKVVSPVLTNYIRRLAGQGKLAWERRKISARDFKNAALAIAATNNSDTNQKVSRLCREKKILANIVDNAALSGFISPAVFRKGRAIVAVYTDGRDPVLSRDLKNFLRENWDEFILYRRRPQKRAA